MVWLQGHFFGMLVDTWLLAGHLQHAWAAILQRRINCMPLLLLETISLFRAKSCYPWFRFCCSKSFPQQRNSLSSFPPHVWSLETTNLFNQECWFHRIVQDRRPPLKAKGDVWCPYTTASTGKSACNTGMAPLRPPCQENHRQAQAHRPGTLTSCATDCSYLPPSSLSQPQTHVFICTQTLLSTIVRQAPFLPRLSQKPRKRAAPETSTFRPSSRVSAEPNPQKAPCWQKFSEDPSQSQHISERWSGSTFLFQASTSSF